MARPILRWLLAALYLVAGVFHLVKPGPFIGITPHLVPAPDLIVWLTGIAEIAGAAALVQPWWPALRRAAGWSLAAYALAVWPANINHMLIDLERPDGGLGLAYHIPRLQAQPLMIWAAPWAAGAFDWPFRQRS